MLVRPGTNYTKSTFSIPLNSIMINRTRPFKMHYDKAEGGSNMLPTYCELAVLDCFSEMLGMCARIQSHMNLCKCKLELRRQKLLGIPSGLGQPSYSLLYLVSLFFVQNVLGIRLAATQKLIPSGLLLVLSICALSVFISAYLLQDNL
ncbi:hypothetical protein POTOM_041348 [Populus tomentosa]|uniref:Uncharacterized protein n=1 Tax=Populus tomentosa TaxID=118781 RepID=A0A8X7YTS2_POPTO|nr:hypothetical protein POTOM_041348 [Populus tomentosa]